jgi:DNA repair protein RadC
MPGQDFPIQVLEGGAVYLNRSRKRWLLEKPGQVAHAFREIVGCEKREVFLTFLCDTRHRVRHIHVTSIGSLNASIVHPREVFHEAVKRKAAAIVVAHNHPSGDPSPSGDDVSTTERLKKAGELLGIELLDHVIVAGRRFCSFREEGLLR